MDIGDIANISITGNCFTILIFDSTARTATADYDSIFACLFEIFDAKKSHQSDFQVSFSYNFGKVKQISNENCSFVRRSSQQIYNVTLFFLFFMSLYGLLGVQFFGELKNHCVMNTTTLE